MLFYLVLLQDSNPFNADVRWTSAGCRLDGICSMAQNGNSGAGLGRRIGGINDYLDASIEEVDEIIKSIPNDERVTWDELNEIFLKILGINKA